MLLGGAREHDRVAAARQRFDQFVPPVQRLHLVDQLPVELLLRRPHPVAHLALEPLVAERRDELIAAHPDVAVNAPQRKHDPVPAKRPIPGQSVVIVGVHERPVDVEDRCRGSHEQVSEGAFTLARSICARCS